MSSMVYGRDEFAFRPRAAHARGGHQHVHRAERFHAGRDHRVVGRLLGGIGLERQRLPPGRLRAAGRLLRPTFVQVGDARRRTFRGVAERAGPADAAAAAGDHRDLSL
jgi:hypothetical protein